MVKRFANSSVGVETDGLTESLFSEGDELTLEAVKIDDSFESGVAVKCEGISHWFDAMYIKTSFS